jgi:pyridoxal phosphate enzyme (YggS family)
VTDGHPARPDARRIADALIDVRDRISRAGGVGVRVMVVTKTHPGSVVSAAVAAGVDLIGENYAQEIRDKGDDLAAARAGGVEVHMIGQLQSNKVRVISGRVDVVQSVDRLSLAAELGRRVPGHRVMVQVGVADEPGKGGCAPADVAELVEGCRGLGLVVDGLMTVGPTSTEPVATGRAFAVTRRLVDELGLVECSMGMSGDLEIAVAEGSTIVRVGSALLGPR